MYGTFNGATVIPQWAYNYQALPFNTTVSKQVTNGFCFQFSVQPSTFAYTLEVSRQAPGGFPIFYVVQGSKASVFNNAFFLDTNEASYQSKTVKYPYNRNDQNPGLWTICTQDGFNGAFLLKVTPDA
jgi:hypothetical protein